MKYIRKINNKKNFESEQGKLYDTSFLSGDILFSELKTGNNTLSLWGFEKASEVDVLIVALALGRDTLQKLTYVIIDESEITDLEIPIEPERGLAEGIDDVMILDKHVNLRDIDFWRLGLFAELICKVIKDSTRCVSLTKDEVFNLIHSCVAKGIVNPQEMKAGLRDDYLKYEQSHHC